MQHRIPPLALVALAAVPVLAGCSAPSYRRAGVLEYLYPEGKEAVPPTDVSLQLPISVGLAFVPESSEYYHGQLEVGQKERVLERVRAAFQDTADVDKIEVVPTSYMTPRGGFENVEQLSSMLGFDVVVLISYDQTQYDEATWASITYWTIVGAYVIPGNANETHTMVDASVFDVRSHALLFNAAGRSKIEGSSTAVDAPVELREASAEGLDAAVDDMIVQLEAALVAFREQAKSGTVRGRGTPEITVTDSSGRPVGGGGFGAGAFGGLELLGGLALAAGVLWRRRRA
jgi:rhombotail lipoprotein